MEPRTRPQSRRRSRSTSDKSTAGCAAGLGFPAFHEGMKKPNTSVSARMPQQKFLPPESEARAARPVPPSHGGGGRAAGAWPEHTQGRQHRPAWGGTLGTGLGRGRGGRRLEGGSCRTGVWEGACTQGRWCTKAWAGRPSMAAVSTASWL